jgi:integrase
VEHRGPKGDRHGKDAEDELVAKLKTRGTRIDDGTTVGVLIDRHIDQLEQDGRAARTIDTYRYDAERLKVIAGAVKVAEVTPGLVDTAIQAVKAKHGATTAKRARTLMRGGLRLAVLSNLLPTNPVADIKPISMGTAKGATAMTGVQLRQVLAAVQASDECHRKDLVDAITVLAGTGMRRSELLGLRWKDIGVDTITIGGKVVRRRGQPLTRIDGGKTDLSVRTIAVPKAVIDCLDARRKKPFWGHQPMVFPSTVGSWRDPENLNTDWREVRESVGAGGATTHTFRKTVATLMDEAGHSARVIADHLGHAKISMTTDVYLGRNRVHPEAATTLNAVINTE